MAKKKAAPKKTADASISRSQTKKVKDTGAESMPAAGAAMHVFRHEIQENPNNAPLVVEIPIAEGRGDNPASPAFVAFTPEMAEEYWQDQFAFRLLSMSGGSVRVMISRVDKGPAELGWGVKLVVHVLVVDTNPE